MFSSKSLMSNTKRPAGASKQPRFLDMSIPAELNQQTAVRLAGQICRHDGNRAAKEREW
jgi:hypothetical protein